MKYNRIAIIGRSATGKTTLSDFLSNITHIPVFHVDDYIFPEKLKSIPEETYLPIFEDIIRKEQWIIDGYINTQMINRLHNADIVIYLNYNYYICIYRYLKRWWNHRVNNKDERKINNLEKFSFKLLFLEIFKTLFFSQKREIEKIIKDINKDKIIRIDSPRYLKNFLNSEFDFQYFAL